jgi:hypothetical protein
MESIKNEMVFTEEEYDRIGCNDGGVKDTDCYYYLGQMKRLNEDLANLETRRIEFEQKVVALENKAEEKKCFS